MPAPIWTLRAAGHIWDGSTDGTFPGTTVWSQHAWANALDVGPYHGVDEQQRFYDFLMGKPVEVPDMHTSSDHANIHVNPPNVWADTAWAEYKAAKYTTVDESRTWEARREDLAYFRQQLVVEVGKMIDTALAKAGQSTLTAAQVRKIVADALTNG